MDTAHIKDLSVDTIKIKDGAVSANGGAVRPGTITVYTTPGLICSCSVTTVSGQSVFVHATGEACAGALSGSWHKPTYVALYRGSTQLVKLVGSGFLASSLPFSDLFPFAISWVDSPGAGTYTYALRAWCEYPSGSAVSDIPKVSNCALSVFQFKK